MKKPKGNKKSKPKHKKQLAPAKEGLLKESWDFVPSSKPTFKGFLYWLLFLIFLLYLIYHIKQYGTIPVKRANVPIDSPFALLGFFVVAVFLFLVSFGILHFAKYIYKKYSSKTT